MVEVLVVKANVLIRSTLSSGRFRAQSFLLKICIQNCISAESGEVTKLNAYFILRVVFSNGRKKETSKDARFIRLTIGCPIHTSVTHFYLTINAAADVRTPEAAPQRRRRQQQRPSCIIIIIILKRGPARGTAPYAAEWGRPDPQGALYPPLPDAGTTRLRIRSIIYLHVPASIHRSILCLRL